MEKKMIRGRSTGHPWEAEDGFPELDKFDEQAEYVAVAGPNNPGRTRAQLAARNLAQNVRGYVTRDAARGRRQVHDEPPPTSGPPVLEVKAAGKNLGSGLRRSK